MSEYKSPMAARAGYHSGLSIPGTCARTSVEVRNARRDIVPVDSIAATCRPMTNMPPIIAAAICATRRVRTGPISLNKRIVNATANAVVAIETAISTP